MRNNDCVHVRNAEAGSVRDRSYSAGNVFVFFFKQKTAYELLRSLVGSEMCIRDRTTRVS